MDEDIELPDAGPDTGSEPPATGNRRAHARLKAEDLRDLGARLASGAEIRLIDLSRGGAQFECDRRFLPNSTISLRLVTPDTTFVVSGRVVRSRIVRLDRGGLGYNVAVSFNELLQNLLEEPAPSAAEPAAEPAPATEPATLAAAEAPAPSLESAADAAMTAAAVADDPFMDRAADVSADEAAAFASTAESGSTVVTVTAAVDQSSDELRDLFNGNNW